MPTSSFDDHDLDQLRSRRISLDEIQHQLLCFRNPPSYADLVRPCSAGDGVRRLAEGDREELLELHARASSAGRLSKFVPASGAATRMFSALSWVLETPPPRRPSWTELEVRAERDPRAAEIVRLVREVADLPFRLALAERVGGPSKLRTLSRDRAYVEIAEALVADDALAMAALPKGLVPFHEYEDGEIRTAFEEHLVEAAQVIRERDGRCRLHFTVSSEHLETFAALLREVGSKYAARYDVSFDVSYSVQKPSTDTIAVDTDDRPFRTVDGRILFRPGGHGALIENLDELQGDIVLIKNIDNVQRDRDRETVVLWKRLLVGSLVRVQALGYDALHRLKSNPKPRRSALDEIASFVLEEFGVTPRRHGKGPDARTLRSWLIDRLERPIRVCGVVANTGEPGGGPFWVRDPDGQISPQIVETSQIDPDSDAQQRILARATHFNPVDLVCGLRDAAGEPYVLQPLVDADAVMVSRKTVGGRTVKALERPGLWNGGMAGWNTVFVEVPVQTFSPVKSVVDLLRSQHRSGSGRG